MEPGTVLLWVDGFENFPRLTSKREVGALMDHCLHLGIGDVVLGVKDLTGFVLYKSRIAPHMSEWSARTIGTKRYKFFPRGYDLLRDAVFEAHKRGMRIFAAFAVFCEGLVMKDLRLGPAVERYPEWQSLCYTGKVEPVWKYRRWVFVNPAHPEVRRYELSLIAEVVSNYEVDGVVLDYCRFAGDKADVGEATKRAFEKFLGRRVRGWPKAVFSKPLYPLFVKFKAKVIRDFVASVRREVKAKAPKCMVGVYVAGWWRSCYKFGQNWARPNFPWRGEQYAPGYGETSMLPFLDLLIPGLYFPAVTPEERRLFGTKHDVRTGAREARWLAGDFRPVYGGLFVKQFFHRHRDLIRAAREILGHLDGVMLFDYSWVRAARAWGALGAIASLRRGER